MSLTDDTESSGRSRTLWLRWAATIAVVLLLSFLVLDRLEEAADRLEASASSGSPHGTAGTAAARPFYRCTMPECNDPGSFDPDSHCPVCGMRRELVPVLGSADEGEAEALTLGQRARQLAGLATEIVRPRNLRRLLRTVGTVEFDETRQSVISALAEGEVEELSANVTGMRVRAGDDLLVLHSLELLEAQNDLLRLLWGFGRIPGRGRNRSVDQDLITARHALELMGMTPEEIDQLVELDHEHPYLTVRAPHDGTLVSKDVFAGQYVNKGDVLFEIADLSRVWLMLDIYEQDLPAIAIGQEVSVTTPAVPGRVFGGHVTFIDPVVDTSTRTVRVRANVANRDHRLKPGMFVTAEVTSPVIATDGVVAVPREAVLQTGDRSLVYIELRTGTYAGAEIVVGPPAEDESGRQFFPVLHGLEGGESVVTRGAFVIDSQMQITGLPSLFTARGLNPGPGPGGETHPPRAAFAHHPGSDPGSASPEPAGPGPDRASNRYRMPETAAVLAGIDQKTCPVTGRPIDPSSYLDYQGVRIHFCCHLCTRKFLADPARYIARLPEEMQRELKVEATSDASPTADD